MAANSQVIGRTNTPSSVKAGRLKNGKIVQNPGRRDDRVMTLAYSGNGWLGLKMLSQRPVLEIVAPRRKVQVSCVEGSFKNRKEIA
jgi:hypothetical protein